MTVFAFPAANMPVLREGVTHAQAMEVLRRFCAESEACPTIAHRMNIPYDTVCKVMDGAVWPGARQVWIDRCMP